MSLLSGRSQNASQRSADQFSVFGLFVIDQVD